jgi:MFS family permease
MTPSPHAGREWWRAGLAVAAVGWGAQQFTSLLLFYQARLHLTPTVVQVTWGLYVVGLIPGMLLGGPVSDRFGRRPVMLPTLGVSIVATLLLIPGGESVGWLFAGRLLAGVASGAAFSSGAAWIKELSAMDTDAGSRSGGRGGQGPRRLTIATSVGFGLGPLVAGVLAQWAPAPSVLPYVPHLLLTAAAVPLVLRAPETRPVHDHGGLLRQLRIPELRGRRFRRVVVPLAPWVFGTASVAMAYLPGVVRSHLGGHGPIFSAVVAPLAAFSGILVQPLARRVHRRRLLVTSLAIVVAGMLVAALAAAAVRPSLVILAAVVLGAGYGCCQVYGLIEVQRLASPHNLAGLTAAYQAVSYTGFVLSVPLAAASRAVAPGVLLLVVAGFAAVTLVWTTVQARVPDSAREPEAEPSLAS